VKEELKVMAWIKVKTAAVLAAATILTAGTAATMVVEHPHQARTPANFPRAS
jgi:hypothetical protein